MSYSIAKYEMSGRQSTGDYSFDLGFIVCRIFIALAGDILRINAMERRTNGIDSFQSYDK